MFGGRRYADKFQHVKNLLTVWLPVAAITALTFTVAVTRRGNKTDIAITRQASLPETISESVSTATEFSVIDGDSLKVTFGADIPVSIRLSGIDAPELGQHYGFEAKENLERHLAHQSPEMTFRENDKYGRKVCEVSLNGMNLNLQLVLTGFAWASPDAGVEFQSAQNTARDKGLGIWSRSNPTPPWEWRAKK